MERHHFEAELQALRNQLLTMGGLVEERVHRAVHALIHRREEDAQRIIATDKEINDLQMDIDNRCLKLLATQTPLAVDLRLITSAMKINADLERIGDQAVNIAESVLVLIPQPPLKPLIDIPRMAAIAEKMIRDALDAFVKRDAELARDVLRRDDEVDELKDQVFRELLTYMMADPGTIQRALSLILISRNLERIADHATNIAEDVIFIVEAKDVRHHAEAGAEAVKADRAEPVARPERREPIQTPGPAAADTRRRVLLIEDDNDIAEAISYQLEKVGLSVRVARTGEEGLEAVRKGVDLVLLDLNLPGHGRPRGLPDDPAAADDRARARSSSSPRAPTRWTACSASRWAPTTTW